MSDILIGDSIYELDAFYREGARARRACIPYVCCGYRESYRRDQWVNGHSHEDEGEHIRFGQDVLTTRKPKRFLWEEDPAVPRDRDGNVDDAWYQAELTKLAR